MPPGGGALPIHIARHAAFPPETCYNSPMLLSITTDHPPATDLGFLLHKHPRRFQSFPLAFGQAHVFYPQVSDERCTACLLLDVDPIGMVRGRRTGDSLLSQYVNDRPFVASSLLSVAIAQVFGSALQGRCVARPELVATPLPLSARLDVLPVRGGEGFLQRVFGPLGYLVEATRHPLDERFADWGESPYFSVTVTASKTLSELLTHLYVLIPVFDNHKHYFVGDDELEKLLAKGAGWLADHPEKEQIARMNAYSACWRWRASRSPLDCERQSQNSDFAASALRGAARRAVIYCRTGRRPAPRPAFPDSL